MNRRAFLGWLASGAAAAAVVPVLGKLEALAVDAPLVLAVDPTVPLWLLELQAYQRLYNAAWSARMDRTFGGTPRGYAWRPTFPVRPEIVQ